MTISLMQSSPRYVRFLRRLLCVGSVAVLAACGGESGVPRDAPVAAPTTPGFESPEALVAWLRSIPDDVTVPAPEVETRFRDLCLAETEGHARFLEEQFAWHAPIRRSFDALHDHFGLDRPIQGEVHGYPYAGCWRITDPTIHRDPGGRRARVAFAPSIDVVAAPELQLVELDGAWRISGYTFEYAVVGYDGTWSPTYRGLLNAEAYRALNLAFIDQLRGGAYASYDEAYAAFRALGRSAPPGGGA